MVNRVLCAIYYLWDIGLFGHMARLCNITSMLFLWVIDVHVSCLEVILCDGKPLRFKILNSLFIILLFGLILVGRINF